MLHSPRLDLGSHALESLMLSVLYFVILVGVLVFVHEFGHFFFARLFKVRVLSFSIGFGPKMVGFIRGDTHWVIRWLPIGGYVLLLGADPTEEISEEDKAVALNFKAFVATLPHCTGGPLFNLLLPIPILFAVLSYSYSEDYPPVVGQVIDGTPAMASSCWMMRSSPLMVMRFAIGQSFGS